MESLSDMDIYKMADITYPSSDSVYLINSLLSNESKIDRLNINANINVGSYDKVVVKWYQ